MVAYFIDEDQMVLIKAGINHVFCFSTSVGTLKVPLDWWGLEDAPRWCVVQIDSCRLMPSLVVTHGWLGVGKSPNCSV